MPAHCIGGRKPGSIGETEKRTILEAARKLEPERRVWFIANGRTWIDRFEVYFLPDEVNGRARKGKAMAFSYRDEAQARAWLPGRDRKVEIFDYVQVGDEPPENFEPRPQNMPFRMPKGLTLAEVDEIVARIQSNEKLPDSKTLPLEINHKYPILHINRQGDEVEVTTGFSRGMLNGNGEILRFKKENGKWVIRDMAWWVS